MTFSLSLIGCGFQEAYGYMAGQLEVMTLPAPACQPADAQLLSAP